MKTVVEKSGNSLALRISKAFTQQAKVTEGSTVRVTVEDGRMIVTPFATEEVLLKKLLPQMRPENIHPETDWGPPVGKEVW